MTRIPRFIGLHAQPNRTLKIVLAILPFVILLTLYLIPSYIRLVENPNDKIMPALSTMAESFYNYAFVADRNGTYILFNDTVSSLYRLSAGLALAAFTGLMLGIHMSLFAGFRAIFSPVVTFLSNVPPLALSPIILITLGTGDLAKILIIFIGVVLTITRDIYNATNDIPNEQITKTLTLGSYQWEVVYKIILPQILPVLIDTVRLCLITAWLYLIAGEAIASTEGLGYRIFLVKRYLAMDVIIPYVLWITSLAAVYDYALRLLNKWCFPWYIALRGGK